MHTFAYGGQIPNFPYVHEYIMHLVSYIPVCVAGSVESPYAYGDSCPINHNTRTGFKKVRYALGKSLLLRVFSSDDYDDDHDVRRADMA